MPAPKSKTRRVSRKSNAKAAESDHEDFSDERESDDESHDGLKRDEQEDELERLVLGDGGGWQAAMGTGMDLDKVDEGASEEEETGDTEPGFEGLDDADLFFLDAGPSAIGGNAMTPVAQKDEEAGDDPLPWDDSDDDRLAVSLAGNPRLRKLRINEAEDVVSGREYSRRLRRQFERLNPVPEWALHSRPAKRQRRDSASSTSSVSSNDMDVDEPDLSTLPLARMLQDVSSLTRTATTSKRTKLRPEVLDIQRTRDIPLTQPSAITSLSFHPEYPVLLSSGPASTLYLHHIAPTAHPIPNPLLTSVHIRHTPLATSAFLHPTGDKIVFSGRRRYFHTWDLPTGTIQKVTRIYGHQDSQKSMERFKLSPCGRFMGLVGSSKKGGGVINILDANTTQWIASARIEGKNGVADFCWWKDGSGLTVMGKGGEIGEWSIETQSFLARWYDDGSIGATVLTLGGSNGPASLGGDRWIVTGSQSGIVNIYDRRSFVTAQNEVLIPERPTPKKSFAQLITPTSNVAISPDGQLLVFSSRWKKDALRLVHLPSCTVYRNWPTSNTPLGRVSATAWSSGSDMLAVANEAGKIKLWEIRC